MRPINGRQIGNVGLEVWSSLTFLVARFGLDIVMRRFFKILDFAIVPFVLLAIIVYSIFPLFPFLLDVVDFGVTQIVIVTVCLIGIAVSLWVKVHPIGMFKKYWSDNPLDRRAILISVVLSLFAVILPDLIGKFLFPPVYSATRYGWSVVPDRTVEKSVQDAPETVRTIKVRYGKNGFKRWGDINSKKIKMLILGDSQTEMAYVSNGEEWYAYIERNLNAVELFVFGGGGYGTLQTFMVLDDSFNAIRPDILLWQFCDNDYANNLYELDIRGYPFNNHAVRPYLEDGKIEYRLPLPFSTLRRTSFIADRLLVRHDNRMWRIATENIDRYLENRTKNLTQHEKQVQDRLLKQAHQTTDLIFAKIRNRVGNIPIYLFNGCGSLTENEEKLCQRHNLVCIPGVSEYVLAKKAEGLSVTIVNDGHWNKLGNQLAGQYLSDFLNKTVFVTTRPSPKIRPL